MEKGKEAIEWSAERPKLNIVDRAMQRSGANDRTRIESFYAKLKKELANQISDRKFNMQRNKSLEERQVEKLKGQLEDAKEDLETCYEDVTPENVSSSVKAENFKETYFRRIEEHQTKVDKLTAQIDELKDFTKEYEKTLNAEIKEFQSRLEKLNELK